MGSTPRVASAVIAALLLITARETACAFTSFSISGYPDSNALGLAVDPYTGSTFFTSLSYGGGPNLFEFNAAGSFVRSARVPFNLSPGGNLGKMVVGGNGNLFIHAVVGDNASTSIIEVSRDFSTVLSVIPGVHAEGGMTLNPMSGNLLYMDYRSNYAVIEITTQGAFVGSQTLRDPVNKSPSDLAYDASGQKLFMYEAFINTPVGRLSHILREYQVDGLGQFAYLKSYSMNTIPWIKGPAAIDFNNATGKFYAQDNNQRVVIFGLEELQVIPEPSVLSMLGVGALVLLGSNRRSG